MKIVVLDSSQADLYQNGEEREACSAIRLNYVTNELPRLLAYSGPGHRLVEAAGL